MVLGKPGRLWIDQPTITGELGPATDAYTNGNFTARGGRLGLDGLGEIQLELSIDDDHFFSEVWNDADKRGTFPNLPTKLRTVVTTRNSGPTALCG